jgi:Domain of unknown function (DUF1707)
VAIRNDLRASDAERDSAAAALREHFVQGRLTLEELLGRLDTALTARMRSQLDNVLSDLPARKERPAPVSPEPADPAFPARYAAVAVLIIVMAVWLVLAAWFSQRGYGGYGDYGYPPH